MNLLRMASPHGVARRPALARTFARRARRGRNNNNNGNNNSNERAVVRGENYEEPSASAKTSILYRAVGGLGACAALTGYLYFVYNPGQGDRRYARQRAENDQYFEDDKYRDGDWDHLDRTIRDGGPGEDGSDGGALGDTDRAFDGYFDGQSTDDPYANSDQEWGARDRRTSSEAQSRSTWT